MPKKYHVKLSKVQRERLQELTSSGTIKVRKYKRARVLLLADEAHQEGYKSDAALCQRGLGVSRKRETSSWQVQNLHGPAKSTDHCPGVLGATGKACPLVAAFAGEQAGRVRGG